MNMKMYRQGDILIIEREEIPDNLEFIQNDDHDRIVLAWGESTNHSHAIKDKNATYFFDKTNNKFYLFITKPVELQHEEHSTITFPVGKYEIIRQRFYTPEAIKYVAD